MYVESHDFHLRLWRETLPLLSIEIWVRTGASESSSIVLLYMASRSLNNSSVRHWDFALAHRPAALLLIPSLRQSSQAHSRDK